MYKESNSCSVIYGKEFSIDFEHTVKCVLLFSQEDQGVYHGKVRDMISKNECRLIVNINDLRRKNEKRAVE